MAKIILTVVCALVVVALGTSIIVSTLVQGSAIHSQSKRIAALQQEETGTLHQVSTLRTELRMQARTRRQLQHNGASRTQLQLTALDGRVVSYRMQTGWRREFVAS